MSYSQGGEESAILAAVADMPTGRVLDVGAAHPTTFSNSRALIERGWWAVLVEPSPDHFLELYREYAQHGDVELILAAVDTHWGLARFWHTQDLVSTTVRAHHEKWRGYAAFDGMLHVATVPLEAIIDQFGPFDVISIDTEGTSAKLAPTALAQEPRVLCVEHDNDQEVEQRAFALGYRRIYASPENWIFAR